MEAAERGQMTMPLKRKYLTVQKETKNSFLDPKL